MVFASIYDLADCIQDWQAVYAKDTYRPDWISHPLLTSVLSLV